MFPIRAIRVIRGSFSLLKQRNETADFADSADKEKAESGIASIL
jgi:hypothetical protein